MKRRVTPPTPREGTRPATVAGARGLVPAILLALVPCAAGAARAAEAPAVVIEHARVFTGDGPVIEDGTVVMRADRIAAVGASADVKAPDGATIIDGKGAWLTAGLFDAESHVGLTEVSGESTTVDTALDGRYDAVRAAFAAVDGLNPSSVVIPVTRIEGVTTAALAPEGGFVSGRSAVIDLDGRSADDMLVRTPTAVWLSFGLAARAATYGARGGVVMRLRELLDDVRQYGKRRADFERNQMRKVSASRLDLEALLPVVEGKLPVVVDVHAAADIEAVLRLAREEGLKIVLTGCEEGWRVAPAIARAGVLVIVEPVMNLPESFERLGSRLDNAALLARAGVKVAISSRSRDPNDAQNSRVIRQEAGNAVANGLPWADALRAVTLVPAEIHGVADRYGSLSAGKVADVVLWSGDPFETSTRVERVFIRGRDIPLRSRQTELRDRYRDLTPQRPRP